MLAEIIGESTLYEVATKYGGIHNDALNRLIFLSEEPCFKCIDEIEERFFGRSFFKYFVSKSKSRRLIPSAFYYFQNVINVLVLILISSCLNAGLKIFITISLAAKSSYFLKTLFKTISSLSVYSDSSKNIKGYTYLPYSLSANFMICFKFNTSSNSSNPSKVGIYPLYKKSLLRIFSP